MRIFYAVVAIVMYGAGCGALVGASQEALRARQQRDEAEDSAAWARSRAFQAEKNLNACILLYADAEKVEDRCQSRLKRCLGVPEFGR